MNGRFWPYVLIGNKHVTISLPWSTRFSFSLEPPADSNCTRNEWLWFGLLLSARQAQVELGEDDIRIFDVVRKKVGTR